MVATKKSREVMNLSSLDLDPELKARMQENVDMDPELRHVKPTRRRAPWLRKAIETLCEIQEKERNGKGGE